MLGLFLVACLAAASAAPVHWSDADTSVVSNLERRATHHTFNSTDLTKAWDLLKKYAPITAANAEATIANMTDEDKAAFNNKEATKMTQILSASYIACGECVTEAASLSELIQVNVGKLYTFVINFELLLNTAVDTTVFTDADRAVVDELMKKVNRGSFSESDLTKAWSLLRKYAPVVAARAMEIIRTMSVKDKDAFKHKEESNMMSILSNSYIVCGECASESSKLSGVDQINVGELYAFVINYGVISSA